MTFLALNAMFVDTVDTGVCGLSRKSSILDEPVSTVLTNLPFLH